VHSSRTRTAPLTRGARVQWGETPLHRAANCGNGDAVTALLAAGADAKAQRHVRAPSCHTRSLSRAPADNMRVCAHARAQDGLMPLDVAACALEQAARMALLHDMP
jgi:hypothetical protein